jgi:nitrite reductase/ring-hydroxylating ferredoxin subunit
VVYGMDGQYHAYRNVCPHSGRPLDPNEAASTLTCCSISESTYDYAGNVLSGPAEESLKPLRIENRQCKVIVWV